MKVSDKSVQNAVPCFAEECYHAMYSKLNAIPVNEIRKINLPLEEAVHEGNRTVKLVEQFNDELRKTIILPEYLETISVRSGAFSWSVAIHQTTVNRRNELKRRWKRLKKEGYALRSATLEQFSYLFKEHPPTIGRLTSIGKKLDDLRMISDLMSLFILGTDNKETLQKVSFTQSNLDALQELNSKLRDLSSELVLLPESYNETYSICKRAWTHLYEAISEIHMAGKYIFRDNVEVRQLFTIPYFQKTARMSKRVQNGKDKNSTLQS